MIRVMKPATILLLMGTLLAVAGIGAANGDDVFSRGGGPPQGYHDEAHGRGPGHGFHHRYRRGQGDGRGRGQGHDHDHDHDEARQALDRHDILPLRRILEGVATQFPGDILEVELEAEHGRWLYELMVLATDGRMIKVKVDAATGQVMSARGAGLDRGEPDGAGAGPSVPGSDIQRPERPEREKR